MNETCYLKLFELCCSILIARRFSTRLVKQEKKREKNHQQQPQQH